MDTISQERQYLVATIVATDPAQCNKLVTETGLSIFKSSRLLWEFSLLNVLQCRIVDHVYIVGLVFCRRVIAVCSTVFDVHSAVVIRATRSSLNWHKADFEKGKLLTFHFTPDTPDGGTSFLRRLDYDACVSRELWKQVENPRHLQVSCSMLPRQYWKPFYSSEWWQLF